MAELAALFALHLRAVSRSRLARTVAILLAAGLLAAAAFGGASPLAVGGALLLVALLAAGAALSAGAVLPEDRVSGRDEWLATLAPPSWKRRLAAALCGWALAAAVGLAGGVVAGGLVTLLDPDARFSTHEAVPVFGRALVPAAPEEGQEGAAWALALPAQDGGGARAVELDVRPWYPRYAVPVHRAALTWAGGGASGALEVPVRGTIRLDLPAEARSLRLALRSRHVNLRVLAVRLLGSGRPAWLALAWAGLVVGLLAGAVAPVAVFVSRRTTGQTAVAAAACLLLFGIVKVDLLALASDLELHRGAWFATFVLRSTSHLAPDVPLLGVLGETGALRSYESQGLAPLLPALVYTAAALLLATLPVPRRLAARANP
jgi:hypothetical protein